MCFCTTLSGNTFYTVSIICSAIAAATTTHPSQNVTKIPRRISGDAAELFFAAIVIIRKSKAGPLPPRFLPVTKDVHIIKADAQDSLCVQSSFYHSFMRLIREQIQRPLLLCGRETHHCNTAQHSGQEASGLPPRPASGIP